MLLFISCWFRSFVIVIENGLIWGLYERGLWELVCMNGVCGNLFIQMGPMGTCLLAYSGRGKVLPTSQDRILLRCEKGIWSPRLLNSYSPGYITSGGGPEK